MPLGSDQAHVHKALTTTDRRESTSAVHRKNASRYQI